MIEVISESQKGVYESKLNIQNKLETEHLEPKDQDFLKRRDCIVRLYVIDACNLPGRVDDPHPDPYLIIRLDKQVINVFILHFI